MDRRSSCDRSMAGNDASGERRHDGECWQCAERRGAVSSARAAAPCSRCAPDADLLRRPRAAAASDRRRGGPRAALPRGLASRASRSASRPRARRERELSLAASAAVNRAYRTLRDPVARGRYWLELHGGRLGETTTAVPPDARGRGVRDAGEARGAPRGGGRARGQARRAEVDGAAGPPRSASGGAPRRARGARYRGWDAATRRSGARRAQAAALRDRLPGNAASATSTTALGRRTAMGRIVGIDLGTTNSLVAVLEDGGPRVLADPETGERLLPSAVAFLPGGEVVVGDARATRSRARAPVRHDPLRQALHGPRPRARERRGPPALSLRRRRRRGAVRFRGRRTRGHAARGVGVRPARAEAPGRGRARRAGRRGP